MQAVEKIDLRREAACAAFAAVQAVEKSEWQYGKDGQPFAAVQAVEKEDTRASPTT